MRLYWEVAKRGFRRHATYRSATVARFFTSTVFAFIRAYVMIALFRHRTDIGGFDETDAVTFAFLSQGYAMLIEAFGADEIAQRVRTGDIVTDLYRPLDFQAYWLAQDLGRAAFYTVARALPPMLFGAMVFHFRFDVGVDVLVAGVVASVLAVVVGFGIRFILNLSAFWIVDIRGPAQIVTLTQMFFAGLILPITFFPRWLEQVARATPFASLMQVPIEILLGKHHGADLVLAVGTQLAWAVALYGIAHAVLGLATRKVVVQGG